ncbi:MAG: hypothetical protein A2Z99_15605 [Treponema sp. GWB1_62_6]|nr:MAG: hypothetical protein A2Z99_15605 [Treponema sp. GWB1_62_6]OHE65528.1 MAG: hypothetical protein A2001_10390 [Treponema sp. GWC1_61_84]OHE65623.1 MAG: hypothetical protein A2Y36_06845 [Treponema sp. GWA1_62_8]HCM27731.1 hypothetical protein [Treponema sp.]
MGLTLTIVAGLTLMTLIASGFDYLGKRSKLKGAASAAMLEDLEKRVRILESSIVEKEDKIGQLEREMKFVNRLLEDKSKG